MKIETKQNKSKPKTLDDLEPGTAFWYQHSLYMKLDKGHLSAALRTTDFNVVSLETGHLLTWTIDNPIVADVKIVSNCISNKGE